MLVIRLHRTGRRNYPSYKIVVTEKTKSAKGGRSIEEVGFYNPATKEKIVKGDRIKYWMSVGAKPSSTIHNLLIGEKIIEGKKIPKHKSAPGGKPAIETPIAEAQASKTAAAPEAVPEDKPEDKPADKPADKKEG